MPGIDPRLCFGRGFRPPQSFRYLSERKSHRSTQVEKNRVGIVFIGGVHGVGKSTHCQHISERTGLQWFMASALIKAQMQSAIVMQLKTVADPIGNQELLLLGVRNCMRPDQGRALLDGHFTLLNADGEIVAIDIDVFVRLGLESIIVIRDDAAAILQPATR